MAMQPILLLIACFFLLLGALSLAGAGFPVGLYDENVRRRRWRAVVGIVALGFFLLFAFAR